MNKISLFVSIEVNPGSFENFLAALKAHVEIIRSEPGCEFIEIYSEEASPEIVHLWEVWSDRQSWDAHMANENSSNWKSRVGSLVLGEKITILRQL